MAEKIRSTNTTFINTGESSFVSLKISQIIHPKKDLSINRLSYSMENIRSPFQSILPLKFPKKRILKGSSTHMLTETEELAFKPCYRPSKFRYQEQPDMKFKKSKGTGMHYKFNQQSEDNNIKQFKENPQSERNSLNSSPKKQSKRIYHHFISKQSLKDPILIGDLNNQLNKRTHKKLFADEQKRKNFSKGSKESIEWKISNKVWKEKFNLKCNAKPLQTKCLTARPKDEPKKAQPKHTQKVSRAYQRPNTYKQMYQSKKICGK